MKNRTEFNFTMVPVYYTGLDIENQHSQDVQYQSQVLATFYSAGIITLYTLPHSIGCMHCETIALIYFEVERNLLLSKSVKTHKLTNNFVKIKI